VAGDKARNCSFQMDQLMLGNAILNNSSQHSYRASKKNNRDPQKYHKSYPRKTIPILAEQEGS
jgi:hypothetical protein